MFDAGRRNGGRAFSGLPVDVALEELQALEEPVPEAPRRRWSDGEQDEPATPPWLDFKRVEPAAHALLIDDASFDEVPAGGPQFAGRPPDPVGRRGRRKARDASRDAPPGIRTSASSRTSRKAAGRRSSRRVRRVGAWMLVLVCLGAGSVVAYPRVQTMIRERSVPSGLRGYVKGKGVAYAPRAQGYSVRLPKQPLRMDAELNAVGGEGSMLMHRSIAAIRDYYIVIRVVDVPPGAPMPFGAVGALADPRVGGADPVNLHRIRFAGQTAYDYDLRSTPPTRARAILRGSRLYVINVQSKSVDTVFDALVKSFRFTG